MRAERSALDYVGNMVEDEVEAINEKRMADTDPRCVAPPAVGGRLPESHTAGQSSPPLGQRLPSFIRAQTTGILSWLSQLIVDFPLPQYSCCLLLKGPDSFNHAL
mmetsp:Transcript_45565/g.121167  ORF Transcript_45565/g.121167 Transcript_45565/m.121167 type:complete len:105 (-) Transcript_45565:112-426(-)